MSWMKCYHHYLAWKKQREARTSQQDIQVTHTAEIFASWSKGQTIDTSGIHYPSSNPHSFLLSLLHKYLNVLDEMLSSLFGAKKQHEAHTWQQDFQVANTAETFASWTKGAINWHKWHPLFHFQSTFPLNIPPPQVSKWMKCYRCEAHTLQQDFCSKVTDTIDVFIMKHEPEG